MISTSNKIRLGPLPLLGCPKPQYSAEREVFVDKSTSGVRKKHSKRSKHRGRKKSIDRHNEDCDREIPVGAVPPPEEPAPARRTDGGRAVPQGQNEVVVEEGVDIPPQRQNVVLVEERREREVVENARPQRQNEVIVEEEGEVENDEPQSQNEVVVVEEGEERPAPLPRSRQRSRSPANADVNRRRGHRDQGRTDKHRREERREDRTSDTDRKRAVRHRPSGRDPRSHNSRNEDRRVRSSDHRLERSSPRSPVHNVRVSELRSESMRRDRNLVDGSREVNLSTIVEVPSRSQSSARADQTTRDRIQDEYAEYEDYNRYYRPPGQPDRRQRSPSGDRARDTRRRDVTPERERPRERRVHDESSNSHTPPRRAQPGGSPDSPQVQRRSGGRLAQERRRDDVPEHESTSPPRRRRSDNIQDFIRGDRRRKDRQRSHGDGNWRPHNQRDLSRSPERERHRESGHVRDMPSSGHRGVHRQAKGRQRERPNRSPSWSPLPPRRHRQRYDTTRAEERGQHQTETRERLLPDWRRHVGLAAGAVITAGLMGTAARHRSPTLSPNRSSQAETLQGSRAEGLAEHGPEGRAGSRAGSRAENPERGRSGSQASAPVHSNTGSNAEGHRAAQSRHRSPTPGPDRLSRAEAGQGSRSGSRSQSHERSQSGSRAESRSRSREGSRSTSPASSSTRSNTGSNAEGREDVSGGEGSANASGNELEPGDDNENEDTYPPTLLPEIKVGSATGSNHSTSEESQPGFKRGGPPAHRTASPSKGIIKNSPGSSAPNSQQGSRQSSPSGGQAGSQRSQAETPNLQVPGSANTSQIGSRRSSPAASQRSHTGSPNLQIPCSFNASQTGSRHSSPGGSQRDRTENPDWDFSGIANASQAGSQRASDAGSRRGSPAASQLGSQRRSQPGSRRGSQAGSQRSSQAGS